MSKPKPASPMVVESWPLSKIIPYDKNPRKNDHAVDAVARSIEQYGFRQPIVVDAHGTIIVGHTRFKAATKLGLATVPVHVARDLTPEKVAALRIADNKTNELAEWDMDLLGQEIRSLGDLSNIELGFTSDEISMMLGTMAQGQPKGSNQLRERFVVPPFSVLDARSGYWQDRKRAWLSLGIKSELGRGAGVWVESSSGGQTDRQKNYADQAAVTPTDRPTEASRQAGVQGSPVDEGQARRSPRSKVSPGGSPRPACDYSKKQRGDGRGKPI